MSAAPAAFAQRLRHGHAHQLHHQREPCGPALPAASSPTGRTINLRSTTVTRIGWGSGAWRRRDRPPAPSFSATRSSPATSTTIRIRRSIRARLRRRGSVIRFPSPRGYSLVGDRVPLPGLVDGANGDRSARRGPDRRQARPARRQRRATLTHGLLGGSPALDAGDPATPGSGGTACPTTDQRGERDRPAPPATSAPSRVRRRRPDRAIAVKTAVRRHGRHGAVARLRRAASSPAPW